MSELGIETSILSVARPGFFFGDRLRAATMARNVNEYAADLVRHSPRSFGFFLSLPLPSIDDSLGEITRGFDELGCDGVVMLANQDGVYLGDPQLDPIFEELDRRSALLCVHPNALPASSPVKDVPVFVADFLLDTTRAALNLVRHGFFTRFPHIRTILSHCGGFLPYAAHRIASLTPAAADGPSTRAEFLEHCRRFYFDTALTASRDSLPSLLEFAGSGRILYGSDFPYARGDNSQYFTNQLRDAGLQPDIVTAIESGTARALIPRLADL